ncbi:hypothetical protein [Pontibacillus marinus]|uniref:Uncharacterized protein n=2 Tax=Pontibacillus TaxID=289201 RepID=A0A0A5G768_9BACI|nr:hypothetical protein [Pontibacillus marinus]KGX86988.1 hypothetical protein N783_10690 [Pontibacillus marinus BH030004 = DSM 16465]
MGFTLIMLLSPLIIIGILSEVKRRKRINTNYDRHRPTEPVQKTDERPHYGMGEDIRGGN